MTTPQPESVPQRPRALGVASGLWISLGAMLILVCFYSCGRAGTYAVRDPDPVVLLIVAGLGAVFVSLGLAVRRGSDAARIAVTVLGGLFSVFLWPLVITVPAIILQFRPSSNNWVAYKQAQRRPPA